MGKKIVLNTVITVMLFISIVTLLFAFETKNWVNVSVSAVAVAVLLIVKVLYVRNVHRELKRK